MNEDFAGLWKHKYDQDPVCVKSSIGYVMTLGGCSLHWVSNLQTDISLSTLESEYIYLSEAVHDLIIGAIDGTPLVTGKIIVYFALKKYCPGHARRAFFNHR